MRSQLVGNEDQSLSDILRDCKEKICLFMIVTPADREMGLASISRLVRHLSPQVQCLVYLNGLSSLEMTKFRQKAIETEWLSVRFNSIAESELTDEIRAQVGDWYQTPEGHREFREGVYENCGEIWTREVPSLREFLTVILLDADCEILDFAVVAELVQPIIRNPAVAVSSAESSDDQQIFDTYSGRIMTLAGRHHTFLSAYRVSAFSVYSNFAPVEEEVEGNLKFFDHAAYLQKIFVENGLKLHSLNGKSRRKYLHYGAFSKNQSLHGFTLRFYRVLTLGAHNGFFHAHGLSSLGKFTRHLFRLLSYLLVVSRIAKERLEYSPANRRST